ncbi:MAG: hypothetical protein IPJ13_18130 [Saprospiraceae bacterium]|nr:hypothetical protein [Saprospiraceae bacterium]
MSILLKIIPKSPNIGIIKLMPKRWWNRELKMWLVPYGSESWQLLGQKFGIQNLNVDKREKRVDISLYEANKNDKNNDKIEEVKRNPNSLKRR